MAPIQHKAFVVAEEGKLLVRQIAVPKPGPGEILVKVVAAAQNPTDWKSAYGFYGGGAESAADCEYCFDIKSSDGESEGVIEACSIIYITGIS